MIKLDNLSFSFPQKDLFHHISFTLEEGVHCAFIGASGNGKSTLLEMMMHPEKYMYEGDISLPPNCRIGYVNQLLTVDSTKEVTVFDYIAETSHTLQSKLALICEEMATATDLDGLFEKYQETLDAFDALGGEDFESIIHKQLHLAGLMRHKDLLIKELSGGEFKLVQIIKEMLIKPDLLIMDEPDVFLDFEHLNALKKLINHHKGTLLVVTHNRYLLNHCFNKILHLENKLLQEFDGRYINYTFSLLEEKVELQELSIADTEEIKRNEAIIEKLREAATATADPSKGRSLKARVKIAERLEARRIQAPFVEIKQPTIDLITTNPLEEVTALQVTDYALAFDETLLEDVNFEIHAGDKVALIGPNGTGKTSLLRAIYKQADPTIEVNEKLKMAYLSQLQNERLDDRQTLLNLFLDHGFETETAVIEHLAHYGFEEERVYERISTLSGGEKNILQLALVAVSEANMLLLDEPTSHLDTYAQLALEEAVKNYNGTVLMVSHDFYTIVNCVDYVLLVENKTIRKISIRKFRKMIYAHHFDKDYLELEQRKKALEVRIAFALKNDDFNLAKKLCSELEALLKLL